MEHDEGDSGMVDAASKARAVEEFDAENKADMEVCERVCLPPAQAAD